MAHFLDRTKLLIGEEASSTLSGATVVVVGVGGVGGACAEALVRAGIGRIILVDHDVVETTNINRQLFATNETIGEKKVLAGRERLLSINEELEVITKDIFLTEDNMGEIFEEKPSYVVDAIDTVTSKLQLIRECKAHSVPIISSMGTGNRVDPSKFLVGDIEDTRGCGCGLAKVMRREVRARDLGELDVLYSKEVPAKVISSSENGRHAPASISYCPPVGGYIIASHVVKKLTNKT